MFDNIFDKLIKGIDLEQGEMVQVMDEIMEGNISEIKISALLMGLRIKGESIEEILGCAQVMRKRAYPITVEEKYAVDTCGTGGDGKNTFNVSTISSIITSAAGVTTVKHGNRSVSSKCGSADVLEKLGVKIDIEPLLVEECIREIKLGFLFAPKFHLSMKYVAPVRKELGIRTLFNLLGPLTNPAKVSCQVMGVYSPDLTEPIAEVLRQLGVKGAFVLHSMDGMDEISIFDKTKVTELKDDKIKTYYIDPSDYNLRSDFTQDIICNTPDENAKIILEVLNGENGVARDMALLNAGAAIYVARGAANLEEGIEKAKDAIDSGRAIKKLESLIKYTNREK